MSISILIILFFFLAHDKITLKHNSSPISSFLCDRHITGI